MLVYKITSENFGVEPFLILNLDNLAEFDMYINPGMSDDPWDGCGLVGPKYCIEIISMTQEEIDALPDFDGFY